MLRRDTLSWCLYDFANSVYAAVIVATIWAAYYANVIVGNAAGEGDLWWGRAVSATMLLVALTSPAAGALADVGRLRKRLLIAYTLISVVGAACLAVVKPGMIWTGFLLTVMATFGFEGAMVFYNAYLPELAAPGHRGRLSGWGYAVGYAGSLAGLLLALPLVKREYYALVFIMVAVCFLVFALPAMFWLPGPASGTIQRRGIIRDGMRATWRTLRDILRTPRLRRYLFAYLVYIDGVNTVIYFSSIFAAHTLGFEMSELIGLFAVVQIAALVGAAAWAVPTDRLGCRRVLLILIGQWTLVVLGAYFVQDKWQFLLLAAFAGTGLGAVQSASRAFWAQLLPRGREGEFFGFYALCGKTASIVGPLVFGTISVLTSGDQRLSVLSVLAFFLAGAFLLYGVRETGASVTPAPACGSQA